MRYKIIFISIVIVSSTFSSLHAHGQQTDYPSNPYNNQNLLTDPYDHQNNVFLSPDQNGNNNQNNNTNNGNNLYGNSDPGGPGTGGGGGTPDDAGVPIDGGIGILLAAGAAAGIRKASKKRRKTSF